MRIQSQHREEKEEGTDTDKPSLSAPNGENKFTNCSFVV